MEVINALLIVMKRALSSTSVTVKRYLAPVNRQLTWAVSRPGPLRNTYVPKSPDDSDLHAVFRIVPAPDDPWAHQNGLVAT